MLNAVTVRIPRSTSVSPVSPRFRGRLEEFAKNVRSWQGQQQRDAILAEREVKLEAAKRIWQGDSIKQGQVTEALGKDMFSAMIPGNRPRRMTFRLFDFLEHYYDQERTAYRETYVFEGFLKGKITHPTLTWRQLMEPLLGETGVRRAAGHINKTLAQFKLIAPAGRWWWSPNQITPLGRAAYEATKDRFIIRTSS